MDIKVNRLSGYKVDNDPKTTASVDKIINLKYWDTDGWSTMYDMSIEDMKKKWKSMDDEFLSVYGDSTSHNLNNTKSQRGHYSPNSILQFWPITHLLFSIMTHVSSPQREG